MKEIEHTVKLFVAFDGKEFPSPAACREYERDNGDAALVGLTAEQVADAANGDLPEVGDAIEMAARKVAAARIAKGETRLDGDPQGAQSVAGPQAADPDSFEDEAA